MLIRQCKGHSRPSYSLNIGFQCLSLVVLCRQMSYANPICHWNTIWLTLLSLQWRHNGCDSVSNNQPHDCFLNRLFRQRSKKISKLRVTGLHRRPVNSPHKWPGTRKMFPFDDVIMYVAMYIRMIVELALKYTSKNTNTHVKNNN